MGKSAVVAGAGGFIGHHLVKFLKAEGYRVRGVDVKLPAYEQTGADEFEKLDSEKLCQYFLDEGKLLTRVARFHNVYGPLGTYDGGREKAPAAICRKVALAKDGGAIEVWGDGRQSRSFLYVDDCVEGIHRIVQSDYPKPLNLGSDEGVTIEELGDFVARMAGKTVGKRHRVAAPRGVRG